LCSRRISPAPGPFPAQPRPSKISIPSCPPRAVQLSQSAHQHPSRAPPTAACECRPQPARHKIRGTHSVRRLCPSLPPRICHLPPRRSTNALTGISAALFVARAARPPPASIRLLFTPGACSNISIADSTARRPPPPPPQSRMFSLCSPCLARHALGKLKAGELRLFFPTEAALADNCRTATIDGTFCAQVDPVVGQPSTCVLNLNQVRAAVESPVARSS